MDLKLSGVGREQVENATLPGVPFPRFSLISQLASGRHLSAS